jgi:Vacuolar sorting-associated protein 13, N-terminal/N-terminal region of Chorein or VPS13
MAKSIVLGILMETLGEFVEISREKLKMAVWSGEIELRDLGLKSGALASLDLPVNVFHGSLSRLKIAIPWTSLGKSSTTIEMEGLIAYVGPAEDASFTADDLQRHSAELKRKILERAERIAYDFVSGELKKKDLSRSTSSANLKKKLKQTSWTASVGVAYVQGLVAKVLANIEFKFRNIHIRYEDAVAMPGRLISAGITMDELLIVTTDDNWVELSSSNRLPTLKKKGTDTQAIGSVMYKIATLRNLSIYWNTDSIGPLKDGTGLHSDARWFEAMRALIYNDGNRLVSCSTTQYIIAPPNLIVIKLAHDSEKLNEKSPHKCSTTGAAISSNFVAEATNKAKEKDDHTCLADVSVDVGHLQFLANITQMDQVKTSLSYRCSFSSLNIDVAFLPFFVLIFFAFLSHYSFSSLLLLFTVTVLHYCSSFSFSFSSHRSSL